MYVDFIHYKAIKRDSILSGLSIPGPPPSTPRVTNNTTITRDTEMNIEIFGPYCIRVDNEAQIQKHSNDPKNRIKKRKKRIRPRSRDGSGKVGFISMISYCSCRMSLFLER